MKQNVVLMGIALAAILPACSDNLDNNFLPEVEDISINESSLEDQNVSEEKGISRIHEYDYRHDKLHVISQEEFERLDAIAQDSIRHWRFMGYRVFHIDDHPGTLTFPDMPHVCDFFMGRIYPDYAEDYWAISYAVERDIYKFDGSYDRHYTEVQYYSFTYPDIFESIFFEEISDFEYPRD